MSSSRKEQKLNTKIVIPAIALIAISGVGLIWYTAWGKNTNKHSPEASPASAGSTRPSPSPQRISKPAPTTQASAAPAVSQPSGSNAGSLQAPTGSLLSSTTISLSSGATVEESTCQTDLGISCSIVIKNTQGSEIGRISAPEVDGRGGHLIDWDVKKYITTPGVYYVLAEARSGNFTSSSGRYKLEVQP